MRSSVVFRVIAGLAMLALTAPANAECAAPEQIAALTGAHDFRQNLRLVTRYESLDVIG